MKATRYDRHQLKLDEITPEGFIQTHGVTSRAGVLVYVNADGTESREAVFLEDLWDEPSIATMRMLPVVNTHRGGMVTLENLKQRKIGHIGENIVPDGDDGRNVLAPIRIDTADGVGAVEDGVVQLSLGYECDVLEEVGELYGEPYNARQVNRRYNHLALVPEARAGDEARIRMDSADAVQREEPQTRTDSRGNLMNKKKIKLDSVGKGTRVVKGDGAEYEVDACVQLYIEDLIIAFGETQDRLDAAKKKLDESAEMNEDAEKKKDKAEAEADTAKDEAKKEKKAKEDALAKIDSLVAEKVAVIIAAEPHLDAETFKRIDSMTTREIQVAAVKALSPKFDATGKSDDYVASRFDSAVEAAGRSAAGEQRRVITQPAGHREDANQGKSIEQLKSERNQKLDSMRTDTRKQIQDRRAKAR